MVTQINITKAGDLTRSGGRGRWAGNLAMSHERPGLLCLLLLLSATVTWEGRARYATSGKFLNCSYDSLRFHCCRSVRTLQGLMTLNCVWVCVCLGSGTAKKCWRRPMTAVVQENMGEVDDGQSVSREVWNGQAIEAAQTQVERLT